MFKPIKISNNINQTNELDINNISITLKRTRKRDVELVFNEKTGQVEVLDLLASSPNPKNYLFIKQANN